MTDDVSKLGCTSVIFLDLVAKVDGNYYCDLLLSQELLYALRHVSNEFVFLKNNARTCTARDVFRH